MSTVDDVAGELGLPTTTVLDACRSLDIVASSGTSGLSADEHRRLRAELHAPADLAPVVPGSTDPSPRVGTVPGRRSPPARADDRRIGSRRRLSPRTATRIAVYAFLVVAVVVAVVSVGGRADEGGTGVQAFSAADEGTCVDLAGEASSRLTPVECAEPHDAELYGVADLGRAGTAMATGPDAPYPGQDLVVGEAERRCGARFAEHVGRPYAESALDVVFLVPTRRTWARGDRTVLCLVEDPAAPLVGSVAGADR